jgi:glycosyltransferase involved in cell wall biosynthesis
MQQTDHIHLRCPGNIGLLGSIIQILFPEKNKTAKYAGNWDYNSKQPFTYQLQKKILSNTFFTKKMKVLVYGAWENSSKNIIPFFTATYRQNEIIQVEKTLLQQHINFIFVGTLVKGKNPLYAIRLIENLLEKGLNVKLEFYGDGIERENLENYIIKNKLQKNVYLKGNKRQDILKIAYQESHFVILPSESEGWPKAIAEGMFWGCVPIATKVSCVPYMLNYGKRGILLTMDAKLDIEQIMATIENKLEFEIQSKNALDWSRDFTLDKFEIEIKKMLLS